MLKIINLDLRIQNKTNSLLKIIIFDWFNLLNYLICVLFYVFPIINHGLSVTSLWCYFKNNVVIVSKPWVFFIFYFKYFILFIRLNFWSGCERGGKGDYGGGGWGGLFCTTVVLFILVPMIKIGIFVFKIYIINSFSLFWEILTFWSQ